MANTMQGLGTIEVRPLFAQSLSLRCQACLPGRCTRCFVESGRTEQRMRQSGDWKSLDALSAVDLAKRVRAETSGSVDESANLLTD